MSALASAATRQKRKRLFRSAGILPAQRWRAQPPAKSANASSVAPASCRPIAARIERAPSSIKQKEKEALMKES